MQRIEGTFVATLTPVDTYTQRYTTNKGAPATRAGDRNRDRDRPAGTRLSGRLSGHHEGAAEIEHKYNHNAGQTQRYRVQVEATQTPADQATSTAPDTQANKTSRRCEACLKLLKKRPSYTRPSTTTTAAAPLREPYRPISKPRSVEAARTTEALEAAEEAVALESDAEVRDQVTRKMKHIKAGYAALQKLSSPTAQSFSSLYSDLLSLLTHATKRLLSAHSQLQDTHTALTQTHIHLQALTKDTATQIKQQQQQQEQDRQAARVAEKLEQAAQRGELIALRDQLLRKDAEIQTLKHDLHRLRREIRREEDRDTYPVTTDRPHRHRHHHHHRTTTGAAAVPSPSYQPGERFSALSAELDAAQREVSAMMQRQRRRQQQTPATADEPHQEEEDGSNHKHQQQQRARTSSSSSPSTSTDPEVGMTRPSTHRYHSRRHRHHQGREHSTISLQSAPGVATAVPLDSAVLQHAVPVGTYTLYRIPKADYDAAAARTGGGGGGARETPPPDDAASQT